MAYKNTFSTILFIKKGKNYKDGEARIFIRITSKGEKKEFSSGISVKLEHWEPGKGKIKNGVKDAAEKNQTLENLIYKVHQCRRNLIEEDIPASAQNILDRYNGTDTENRSLLAIFDEHNKRCEELSGKDFAPATVQKYRSCRKIVADFIQSRYKRKDLPISAIDHKFIKDLEHYIKTVRGCGHNTTIKYVQNFRKIVLIGINNGWLKKDPFQNIKYRKEKTYPAHLDEQELERIRSKPISIDRLGRVRDIFVFCCFTGLAYSDVKELTTENITTLSDGKKCIKKRRKKTGVMSFIPLLEIPTQILSKYATDPVCMAKGQLLPVLSNQKMNAYLKELSDLCKIKKPVTMHTARHTFATTVTLSNNIPIDVVSEMLGHSSLNMTRHYAKVVNNQISIEMRKIENKYASGKVDYKEIISHINYN